MKHACKTALYDVTGDDISVLQIEFKIHSWVEICLDSKTYDYLWTEMYFVDEELGERAYKTELFLGDMEEDELFQQSIAWDTPMSFEFIHQAHKMIKDLIQQHKSYKKITYIDVEFEY